VKPLGFSAVDLMAAGLAGRPRDPWHEPTDPWRWHASALAGCPRQQILRRAGFNTDPQPMEGALTMHLGTVFHAEMENFLQRFCITTNGKVKIVVQEKGFVHQTLPLVAKPDCLLDVDGVGLVLMDFKTEHENAAQHRETEAREAGRRSSVRPEHMLQVAATAMVLESNGHTPIHQGFVLYVSKNSFWIGDLTQNTVDLTDVVLRKEVERKVNQLEQMWDDFEGSVGSHTVEQLRAVQSLVRLPRKLPKDHWNCRPDGYSRKNPNGTSPEGYGKYCSSRSTCFSLPG
jgi:hypothetical protein